MLPWSLNAHGSSLHKKTHPSMPRMRLSLLAVFGCSRDEAYSSLDSSEPSPSSLELEPLVVAVP